MPDLRWFTVFLSYGGVRQVVQLEARTGENAERLAVDEFVSDLDDEDDGFDEADTGFIRSSVSYRTFEGRLETEPDYIPTIEGRGKAR